MEIVSENTYNRRQFLAIAAGATAAVAMNGRVHDAVQPQYDLSRGPEVMPNINLDVEPIDGHFDLIEHLNWNETPGVEPISRGLMLQPLDMRIINKHLLTRDYVDNPPINVCDGYIHTNGDFAITTVVESEAPVHVQLYGEVPKLMDDNRYEKARVDCELSPGRLRVTRHSGGVLGPQRKDFNLPRVSGEHALEVQKIGERLVFIVDSRQVGDIDEDGVFNNGTIWFGLNSLSEYATVTEMEFREIDKGPQESGFWRAGALRVEPDQGETLQGQVDERGFDLMMGSAVSLYPLLTNPQYAQVMLGSNFKILTIENAMKELYLRGMNGTWEPKHALSLMRILQDHGKLINGHTAIYDKAMHKSVEQMPTDTHDDKMRVAKYIEDHIAEFGQEFGQYLYSCDVVNETVDGFGPKWLAPLRKLSFLPYREHIGVRMRDNVFMRALGREWVTIAVKAAAQAMPDTLLGINEYGAESDPGHRGREIYDLVDHVRAQGGRIDYVGFQMHDYYKQWFVNRSNFCELLDEARRREVMVRVSERDVSASAGEVAQAQQYTMVMEEVLRNLDIIDAHIFWGADDTHGSTGGRGPGRELLYDEHFREKFALRALRQTIRNFRA